MWGGGAGAQRTSSGAQRWMARFTGMVAILFLAALAMVLLHHWLSGAWQ